MSTSLIVNIAFVVGVIFSYKLLERIVKSFLIAKQRRNSILSCSEKDFQKKVLEYYKGSLKEHGALEEKVQDLFNDVYKQAKDVIEINKKRLNNELSNSTDANMKKVSDRVTKAIEESKAHTANVAAKVAQRIINECEDEKKDSEVISSLSRDLNKKLH